ncbi:MAG TPA: carboxypeptidase-like regulatory domain-containing protein [Terriglobales bacterium]|nr:carboxypeptidase-like regulatory domain-containing protein [Terriglobales bacterium]
MNRFTKILLGGTILGAAAFAFAPRVHAAITEPEALEQKDSDQNQLKSVTGMVVGEGDAPLPQSVVYLKNMKTLAVKSFIADDAGAFRFYALSPNTDYQVYAEYNGQRSGTKTISAFDSKTKVEMTLKIDIKK